MEIPGLGQLKLEESTGWHYSDPVEMRPLTGGPRRFVFDDFEDDVDLQAQAAVALRFAASDPSVTRTGTEEVYAYFSDIVRDGAAGDYEVEPGSVAKPDEVWDYVTFPLDVHVSRDDDGRVYVDLECECTWEPEHGLQLVLLEGERVTKVGSYDGHLTNAHAYNRPEFEDVVYVPMGEVGG